MLFGTHPTLSSKQPSHIMMNCCSFEGCEKRPTKNGNGHCHNHGGCTRCNHLGCDSIAQKGGMCGRHRPDEIYCSAIGCTKLPVRNGVCIIHGATQYCEIPGCTGHLFCSRKCNFHFNNSMVASPINKNTMGEEDLSNLLEEFNNLTEASTAEKMRQWQ